MNAITTTRHRNIALLVGAVAIVAAGSATAITLAFTRGGSTPTSPAASNTASPSGASFDYYRTMMNGTYGSAMMGGANAWMMGASGYQWMMGGTQAPSWMTGSSLPGFMMQAGEDPGQVMGAFWAAGPGSRVSAADAARLGAAVPAGATVDTSTNRLTFNTHDVHFAIVANGAAAVQGFTIAGLVNPTVVVPQGATVAIQLINADADSAHGLVISSATTTPSAMPMMTSRPAFSGSAMWFLGAATSAGMHDGTVTFTAGQPGTYAYLDPVPLQAERGMVGSLLVGPGN